MELKVSSSIMLKQMGEHDAKDIFDAIDKQRDYLGKWLPFVAFTKKLEDTQAFIASVTKVAMDEREYIFTIRQNSKFIGLIGFRDTDRINRKSEIGYWLLEEYQGQGIVTQAVAKLCDFAFDKLVLNRIQIKCAVGNEPSRKIPRRLKFTYEGIERNGERFGENHYLDLEVYSLLKSDEV